MKRPDSRHGVYAISVAAELPGVHPQIVRVHEREALIGPDRSDGGTGRCSAENVERLRLIAAITSARLDIAGRKAVLALEEQLAQLRVTIEELRAALDERPLTQQPR